MSIGVLLAVLFAAFLHASWNALIKTGANKQTGMMLLSLGHAAIGVVVVMTRPWPGPEVWPWLLASGAIHMAYQLFLSFAYDEGDLSRVYPLARGTAPMVVLVVSAIFAIDAIRRAEVLGIVVLGCGIFLMARGVFRSDESRRMLPFALGAAVATASYSLVDGLGARVSGDAVAYVGWLMIASAAFLMPTMTALRGRSVFRADGRTWALGMAAAAASYGAYAIAVWAMTVAPIALVTALRETSILFAVLIGRLVFGDRMDWGKVLASGLIVAGVLLTRA